MIKTRSKKELTTSTPPDSPRDRKKTKISSIPSMMLKKKPFANLYITVSEANFNGEVDVSARPFVEAQFERQQIDSVQSKNANNPKWKDHYLFTVTDINSKLRIRIFSRDKENLIGETKLSIKHLEDQKQKSEWFNLNKETQKIHITWRIENLKKEDTTSLHWEDESDIVATFQLTVISARDLKLRVGNAPPNTQVVLVYGKQEYKTQAIQNTAPEWNSGFIFRVKDLSLPCKVRVVDLNEVTITHLGTAEVTPSMLSLSLRSTEATQQWLKLQPDPEETSKFVGGEIQVKYRLKKTIIKSTAEVKSEGAVQLKDLGGLQKAEEFPDLNDIPSGWPIRPPKPSEESIVTKEGQIFNRRKKLLEQTWASNLLAYQKKKKVGDEAGAQKILQSVTTELNNLGYKEVMEAWKREEFSKKFELNITEESVAEMFPIPPPKPSNQKPDIRSPEYKLYMRQMHVREIWDNGFRKFEELKAKNDRPGMLRILKSTVNSMREQGYMPAFPKSQNHTRKTRQTMRGSIPVGTKLDLSEIQGSSSGSLRPHTMNLGAQVPDVSGSEQEQNFGFGSLAGFFSDLFETAEAKFTETVYGPFSITTALNNSDVVADYEYKLIVIGDSGVGKTSLLQKWFDSQFDGVTQTTLAPTFSTKAFDVKGKKIKVQLWDTAGQEKFNSITRMHYRGAKGAIVVYDVTNYNSFQKTAHWIDSVHDHSGNPNIQMLLIGNKNDQETMRDVPTEEATKYAKEKGIFFLETSALNGSNVDKAFQIILQEIHNAVLGGRLQAVSESLEESGRAARTRGGRPTTISLPSGTTLVTEPPQKQESGCCFGGQ